VGLPRTRDRQVRPRLARRGRHACRGSRLCGRALHPDRRTARLVDLASGRRSPAGRGRRPDPPARQPPPLLFDQPRVPAPCQSHRRRTGRAVRPPSGSRRMADRQRIGLPRHRTVLLRALRDAVPGLCRETLRVARSAQSGLGHRGLEPALHRMGRDPAARRAGVSRQPRPLARLVPLLVAKLGALPGAAGPHRARARRRPVGRTQLHGAFRRTGSRRAGAPPRHGGLRPLCTGRIRPRGRLLRAGSDARLEAAPVLVKRGS